MDDFKKYIKAVGTGPKGNSDLSQEEMQQAMHMILSGEATKEQIAAFMIGWRLKPETSEEYKGALTALQQKTKYKPIADSYELGFPFDGKNNSPYLFPLIAAFMENYSVNLVVTGDTRIPAKEGITTLDVHRAAGDLKNVHFFDRAEYLTELHNLSDLRNQLGLRTAFNTLEKFSGVAKGQHGASGVFHKPYVEKYTEIFKDHLTSMVLVAGNEGSPEIFKKSKCWFIKKDDVQEIIIDPAEFGINWSAGERVFELKDTLEILKNPPYEMVKLAALNAAVYLFSMRPEKRIEDYFQEMLSRL